MPLVELRPLTAGQRFHVTNRMDVDKKRPEKKLTKAKKRTGGRNNNGRITSRRRGGGHKQRIRIIDFRREKYDIPATVKAIEYDPNRSANLALLVYADGEKRYILAPNGVKVGARLVSASKGADFNPGNSMPLEFMPPAAKIHAVELRPGAGAQMVRSAGLSAQLVNIDGEYATVKLPSGELRMVKKNCRATMGTVGNSEHQKATIGKAGRSRWLGKRPRVRGVAMNPVDHPMGGGEGRTSGGGHPMSPWGQLSKGFPTRAKTKSSNKLILTRRNGRKMRSR